MDIGYEILEGATWEDANGVNVSIRCSSEVRVIMFSWRVTEPPVVVIPQGTYVNMAPEWSPWADPQEIVFDQLGLGNVKISWQGPILCRMGVFYYDDRTPQTHYVVFTRGMLNMLLLGGD